ADSHPNWLPLVVRLSFCRNRILWRHSCHSGIADAVGWRGHDFRNGGGDTEDTSEKWPHGHRGIRVPSGLADYGIRAYFIRCRPHRTRRADRGHRQRGIEDALVVDELLRNVNVHKQTLIMIDSIAGWIEREGFVS